MPPEIIPINAAVFDKCDVSSFESSANRNSTVVATASYEHKTVETRLITVDSLPVDSVDYIKYDVEGAEYEALIGSYETVKKYTPVLLVSLYHRSRDLFSLPLYLFDNHKGYDAYVRRLRCLPAWELDLIMIPSSEKKSDDA